MQILEWVKRRRQYRSNASLANLLFATSLADHDLSFLTASFSRSLPADLSTSSSFSLRASDDEMSWACFIETSASSIDFFDSETRLCLFVFQLLRQQQNTVFRRLYFIIRHDATLFQLCLGCLQRPYAFWLTFVLLPVWATCTLSSPIVFVLVCPFWWLCWDSSVNRACLPSADFYPNLVGVVWQQLVL